MVEDNPLARFVKDYDHITNISLCLDNDEAGKKAIYGDGKGSKLGLKEKYEGLGFQVNVEVPPAGKDFNESLIELKKGTKLAKPKIVKLTGLPVSENMNNILERLSKGEDVTIAEINKTEEIKMARSNILHSIPTIQLQNRMGIQAKAFSDMQAMGAAAIDEEGATVYNGKVEQGSRLDIVIGLPASGKSSAVVDKLSSEFHSRIIDNDDAKKMIPQYNNGWGAGIVHDESQYICDMVFAESLLSNENIVLPKIGSNAEKLIEHYVKPAKELGYNVNVHFVDLDRTKALGRMLNRFIEEGRFIEPDLIEKYAPFNRANRINQAYEQLKESPVVDGFSKWNNDVERGQEPILVEYGNLVGAFIDNAKLEREGEKQNERKENARNFTNHLRDDGRIRGKRGADGSVDGSSQKGNDDAVTRGQIESGKCDIPVGSSGGGAGQEECKGTVANVHVKRGRGR